MEVRIRFGTGIARLAPSPSMTLELAGGATVEDVYTRLAECYPGLDDALPSSVAVVAGVQVDRTARLTQGQEIALLAPISGG